MTRQLTCFSKSALFCIILSLLSSKIHAADENHTLLIHLTNTTQESLQFDHIASTRPGTTFSIDLKTINPGETATITGTKLTNNDLEGYLVFTNSSGDTGLLHVLDQEQLHYGQPIFNFSGTKYKSELVSKTRNPHIGPRFLSYLAADLRVINANTALYIAS